MSLLSRGVAIPACPLALHENRTFDERRQRALLRYYIAAGAGGIAVGVHTTQFEIRDPKHALFKPLLQLASEEMALLEKKHERTVIRIAGVCGLLPQATTEAKLAAQLGYDAALLSLGALRQATDDEMISHCREIAAIIPVVGFYLQPAVGGRILSYAFWRRFAELENIVAIKVAAFNRYQTLDVVRAVADSGRGDKIALYTGNDDNIIADLITPFPFSSPDASPAQSLRFRGGLLGQWSVWTRTFVQLLEEIHDLVDSSGIVPQRTQSGEDLKINPAEFRAQFNIASGLMETEKFDEAIEELKKLQIQHPKDMDVMNLLGWAYLNDGKFEMAFNTWRRAMKVDPLNPTIKNSMLRARLAVGKKLKEGGHYAQALVHFKELQKLLPAPNQWKELLRKNAELTDANAAIFDAVNNFAGCIAGIHEVLRRQGLLEGTWCLSPSERLSRGQADEITRVYRSYPWLNDDEFVREHLDEWLTN